MLSSDCLHRLARHRRWPGAFTAILVLAIIPPSGSVLAQTPLPPPYNYDEPLPKGPAPLPDWQYLTLDGAKRHYRMPVYANHKLDSGLTNIRRAIVVLPSARRAAGHHYQDIKALVARDPGRERNTLILALEFPSPIETNFAKLPAWRKSSWEMGEKSIRASGRPAPVTAFEVLDDVMRWLAGREATPALSDIVLAAHGSGAQLLQRYAILNDLDGALRRDGLGVRYIVANAPSYLYLTNERPRRNGPGYAPYERGICPVYNQYPYGPQQLPAYAADPGPASLYVRYASRDVVYLLGSADTNPEDRGLDKHCGAEAQGATRLSRGLGYVRYDQILAGRGNSPINLTHTPQQIQGVGHDAGAIFGSQCGTQALLGPGARPANSAAACKPITPTP